MQDGPAATEMAVVVEPSRPKNFTPLPEKSVGRLFPIEEELIKREKEPSKQKEQELPNSEEPNKEQIDKIMAEIIGQTGSENPQKIVSEVVNKTPENKQSQGLIARILEWFRTTFRNLIK